MLTLLGQQLFPLNNAWNQNISNAPVAGNSAAIIAHIGSSSRLTPDWGADNPVNGSSPLLREWVEWLLRLLDATQRAIAGSRMEAVTNEEIAGALGLTIRTIERKLATIRLVIGRRLGIDPRKRSRRE
jgi:hypothetical protein